MIYKCNDNNNIVVDVTKIEGVGEIETDYSDYPSGDSSSKFFDCWFKVLLSGGSLKVCFSDSYVCKPIREINQSEIIKKTRLVRKEVIELWQTARRMLKIKSKGKGNDNK